ncbi:hypothetical protein [Bradyrhizobium sp. AZCC 1693]|uniref:hypothetical protein n=1 Tax=Bradyrhizobium sp. AZCC 1693 TaxID=3117029 RepID=UPI002FEEABFD
MISRFSPPIRLVLLCGLIALSSTTAGAAGIGAHLRVHAQNMPRAVAGGHNPHVGVGCGKGCAESRNRAPEDIASMHENLSGQSKIFPAKVVWVTDQSSGAYQPM